MATNKGGRPTKYSKEYADQAYKLCLLGAKDTEIAEFFEVVESTVSKWKLEHPEFSEALKAGKREADAKVADSLYRRAMGYTHPEEKIFCTNGEVTKVETLKHYPPDTTAAIFWLKNRDKANWRDKIDHEHTGENGGPMRWHVSYHSPDE